MPSSACDWSSDVCSSDRSEEHTSELQSRSDLVCRLLLEKKKKKNHTSIRPPHTPLGSRRIRRSLLRTARIVHHRLMGQNTPCTGETGSDRHEKTRRTTRD